MSNYFKQVFLVKMAPHVRYVKILIESDAALSQNKTFEAGQHKKAFFCCDKKI